MRTSPGRSLACISFLALAAGAAALRAAEPPSEAGVYYIDRSEYVELTEPGTAKVSGVGPFGRASADASATLPGLAKFEVSVGSPAFLVVDSNPGQIFFIRSDVSNGNRVVKMAPSRYFGGKKLWVADEHLLEGRLEALHAGQYRLTPPHALADGEYTIEFLNDQLGVRRKKHGGEFRVINGGINVLADKALNLTDSDFAWTDKMGPLDKKNGFQDFVFGSAPLAHLRTVKIPRVHAMAPGDRRFVASGVVAVTVGGAQATDFAYFAGSFSTLPGGNLSGLWIEEVWNPAAKGFSRDARESSLSPDEVAVYMENRPPRTIQGLPIRKLGLNYVDGRLAAIRFSVRVEDRDKLEQIFAEGYGRPVKSGSESSWHGKLVQLELSTDGEVLFKSIPILEALVGFRGAPAKTDAEKTTDL